MDAINPRATMGDNQPSLGERLAVDHAELLKRAAEAAELVPAEIRAIESDEEAGSYTDTAVDIKRVIDTADAAFEDEKKPWREGAKTVDDFFAFRKTLEAAVKRVRSALDDRANALLAAQRKAEKEAAEKAAKEAAAFDEVAVYVAPAPIKDVARVVSSATGNKSSASVKWRGDVVNLDELPRHYMVANQKMIDAAVEGGVREIPGVRIYEAAKTSLRR